MLFGNILSRSFILQICWFLFLEDLMGQVLFFWFLFFFLGGGGREGGREKVIGLFFVFVFVLFCFVVYSGFFCCYDFLLLLVVSSFCVVKLVLSFSWVSSSILTILGNRGCLSLFRKYDFLHESWNGTNHRENSTESWFLWLSKGSFVSFFGDSSTEGNVFFLSSERIWWSL